APQDTAVVTLLRLHGIRVDRSDSSWTARGETFTIDSIVSSPRLFQGHHEVRLRGTWQRGIEALPAKSFIVSTAQPRGALIVYLLGESVHNEAEARAAGREYVAMLDRIHERKANANVSVKLTAMGLDISEELCVAIMHKILQRARECGSFVRIDMESSEYTQRTIDLFEQRLYPGYRENVGIVLQSYLYRTFADVQRANLL